MAEHWGKDNPSGEAAGRDHAGVVEWMKADSAEITALDVDRPLLPQAHLLTDEQIGEAFRSMDPLARAGLSTGYSTYKN